jgi:hypothetical protein
MSQVFFDVEYAPVGTAERKLLHAFPVFILHGSGPGVQTALPLHPAFTIGAELCSRRAGLNPASINTFESFY